jgi:hypothetical protein
MIRASWLLSLLALGCCPCLSRTAANATKTSPALDPASARALLSRRPPLVVVGSQLLHQVAIDLPNRSEVLQGRLAFDAPASYHLLAESPLGMRLFAIRYDGARFAVEVAEPLRGRFPAEQLGLQIARIYLHACPNDASVSATTEGYEVRCQVEGDVRLAELLDRDTLRLQRRGFTDSAGRTLTIQYRE